MIKFITNSKALQVIDGASGVEVEVVVVDGVTDVEVDDGVNKELEFQLISIAELLSTSSSLVGSITQRDLLRLLLGIESQIQLFIRLMFVTPLYIYDVNITLDDGLL